MNMSERVDALLNFASGKINAGALREATADDDIAEFENNPKFMAEATADALPIVVQHVVTCAMLGESAGDLLVKDYGETLDENVQSAYNTLVQYFVGQGIIDEAAAANPYNKKVTFVRLNKIARIAQLRAMYILKMAREKKRPAFKKFKIGQAIRKKNFEIMEKEFGKKADKMAKAKWKELASSPKTADVAAATAK